MPTLRQHIRSKVRDFIEANPTAKNTEVMAACHCSMRMVSICRAELIAEGKAKPAFGDRRDPSKVVNAPAAIARATEGAFDLQTTADLTRVVAQELGDSDEVDIGKLKRELWRVMRRATDDRIVVAAASALARIQQEASSRPLGPQKPMTRKDAVERLILMFKAVGISIVEEAINEWTGNAQTTQPSIATPAPAQAAGAADH